jgi:hypothetical protein
MREFRVFEYEVVPLTVTRAAGDAESEQQWDTLRAALNLRGRRGFRVVAVTDGPEGRAVVMEREVEGSDVEPQTMTQAAEDITWESARED